MKAQTVFDVCMSILLIAIAVCVIGIAGWTVYRLWIEISPIVAILIGSVMLAGLLAVPSMVLSEK